MVHIIYCQLKVKANTGRVFSPPSLMRITSMQPIMFRALPKVHCPTIICVSIYEIQAHVAIRTIDLMSSEKIPLLIIAAITPP